MSQFRINLESANPKTRIKEEAGRRIVQVVGKSWKQLNFLARASELHLKITMQTITAEEQAELQKILGMWGWVKQVRDVSDALEVSNPTDYRHDKHWPEKPEKETLPASPKI